MSEPKPAANLEQLEYKSVALEMKASSKEEGVYEGYFSIFGNVDDGGDIIMPGAFSKTIQERQKRVKVLFGHNWDKLIGPYPEVLHEDAKGLYAKGRLTISKGGNRGAFYADEAWALMKDQALNEGSIAYSPLPGRYEYNDSYTVRTLHEVKLYEISLVPLGMNPLTEVAAVKALWMPGAPGVAGEKYLDLIGQVAAELKVGKVLSSANLDKVKTVIALLQELYDAAAPDDDNDEKSAHHPAPRKHAGRERIERKAKYVEVQRKLAALGVPVS
jgi:HK97 family phage prohead protease